MEPMKFEVLNEDHSADIQRELFKLGFQWVSNGANVWHVEPPYIYACVDGFTIRYGVKRESYEANSAKETTLADLKAMSKKAEQYKAEYDFDKAINDLMFQDKASAELSRDSKYMRTIYGTEGTTTVDVYRVLDAFNVTSPPLQHLIKKALCSGIRGHKDERQDLVDIITAANEALVMFDEKVTNE